MGKRGPKPKPTAVKLANGNPGKRKLSNREPKPHIATNLAPPAWLDRDAKSEWRRVAKELDRLGLYTKLDRSLLIGYCVAYSDYKQARQRLLQSGRVMTFRDDKGTVKGAQVAPEWTIAKQALEQMRRCGAEFGMGPASRVGVESPADIPKNLEEMLNASTDLPDLEGLGAIQ